MPLAARQRAPLARVEAGKLSDTPPAIERAQRGALLPSPARPSSERQRRYRARRRSGLITLPVTVDEVSLAAVLTEAGYLRSDQADERSALQAALQKAVTDFTVVLVSVDA